MLLRLWILWSWTGVTLAMWDAARWKPAVQNAIYSGPESPIIPLDGYFGVDGDNDTAFHTECDSLQWWMVDLQGVYAIKQVMITNIITPKRARLKNFRIDVFKDDQRHDPQFTDITGQICATHGNSALPDRTTIFTCPTGIVGRFVRVIWQPGYSECLHFSELEVLVDDVYSRSILYEVSKDLLATDSPFLSLTTSNFWTCVVACNDRRDTELCTAFNWAPELHQCHLLKLQPFQPASTASDVKWKLYRIHATY